MWVSKPRSQKHTSHYRAWLRTVLYCVVLFVKSHCASEAVLFLWYTSTSHVFMDCQFLYFLYYLWIISDKPVFFLTGRTKWLPNWSFIIITALWLLPDQVTHNLVTHCKYVHVKQPTNRLTASFIFPAWIKTVFRALKSSNNQHLLKFSNM